MAGKHSKSIFDFRKSPYAVKKEATKFEFIKNLSLPFRITLSVFVLTLVVSTILVGVFFMQGSSHSDLLASAKETFYSTDSKAALRQLSQQNSEIIGWLKINGTQIDAAVCQGRDDEFYIDHNQLGEESRYGALFVQAGDDYKRSNEDKNVVIFGNNMKDGTMFGELSKYRNINFYKSSPTFSFYYGDKCETYAVFSVMLISSASDDAGQVYKPYKSYFANDQEFNEWITETKARSMINTSLNVENGDEMLTLVTLADDFEGARFVVMAKRINEWDLEDIDVQNASVNSTPKHPKIWYENKGIKYPY